MMQIKIAFPLFFLFLLTACGGGGGGPSVTPTDPNKVFSLAGINTLAVGTVYSKQIAGTVVPGGALTGSVTVANRTQNLFGGIMTTPRDVIVVLTSGGVTASSTATAQFDSSSRAVSTFFQTANATCTPAVIDGLPSTVKIGDSGIRSTETCDDGTTVLANWLIGDGGDDHITLTSNQTVKDSMGAIGSLTSFVFVLDDVGTVLSFTGSITTDTAVTSFHSI